MHASVAIVTIVGVQPYSQSRGHDEPKLEGEQAADYDIRTWRHKMNVEEHDGKQTVVIPAHGMHQCLADAAKYSKRQIPGQGKATWTAKFTSGLFFKENPILNIDPATVKAVPISCHVNGVRGSGARVTRRFPHIPAGWSATFEVIILDPIITESVFTEMLELAGIFIGIGQFRPQNGGTNGRFRVEKISWADNRRIAA